VPRRGFAPLQALRGSGELRSGTLAYLPRVLGSEHGPTPITSSEGAIFYSRTATRPETARGPVAPGVLEGGRKDLFAHVLDQVFGGLFGLFDFPNVDHATHAGRFGTFAQDLLRDEIPALDQMEMPESVLVLFGDRQILPGIPTPSEGLRERLKPPVDRFEVRPDLGERYEAFGIGGSDETREAVDLRRTTLRASPGAARHGKKGTSFLMLERPAFDGSRAACLTSHGTPFRLSSGGCPLAHSILNGVQSRERRCCF
jgi:hypothetical protein